MNPRGPGEESGATRRSYSPADAAADLALYRQRKWSVALGSLLVVVLVALPLAYWSPALSLALVIGGVCGVGNALLVMYGNERLVERRRVGIFVISSLLRIGLFGIVPVALALRNGLPASLGVYFAGFFVPLALYGLAEFCRKR